MKNTHCPCKIVRLFVKQRKVLEMIGKRIYQVRSWYFHLAFWTTIFWYSVLVSRSLRHKTWNFHAYVEKQRRRRRTRKKNKTRAALHECCMLRIALKRKLARDSINAVLRTALKSSIWFRRKKSPILFIRRTNYFFKFSTSILKTSKQINEESTHFYLFNTILISI